MMEHVKLPNSVKVVIIAGGVIGASVAYHLAERGCKDVLLLEKDGIAAHSSHKAEGCRSIISGRNERYDF